MPRIYNYWLILSLEAFVFVFWLLSISFLALPVGAAFYFVNGGQAGHYSRYDIGFVADPIIIAFIDLMMVSVAAGIIELCVFSPTVDTLQLLEYNYTNPKQHSLLHNPCYIQYHRPLSSPRASPLRMCAFRNRSR